MTEYHVIGIMSGTSMDGVDLAYCVIRNENGRWQYSIQQAETVPYDEKWRLRLSKLNRQDAHVFWKTHVFYGKFLGELTRDFIHKHQLKVDLIASHGHTVFHVPGSHYTCQIGDLNYIHAETGIPVVGDFRTLDVALGGNGAPLVPAGDILLFSQYNFCLNLGGIANISGYLGEQYVGYDICPCNIALNRIARNKGQLFDDDGNIARAGQVDDELLSALNSISFYSKPGPKSLSREWINADFWHLTKEFKLSNEDKARTLTEHIAIQISKSLYEFVDGEEEKLPNMKMLVTGGGAMNSFLMERIIAETPVQVIRPDDLLVQFKEALVFAFLGVLRLEGEVNVLASVTGASRDSVSGVIVGK